MKSLLEKYKGIHPGMVLERLLAKKKLSQRPFALSLGEHPQTINAITKRKRNVTVSLALKMETALGLEEGTLALLQTYYEIAEEKKKTINTSNVPVVRKSLFWDTDMAKIDWKKQYKAIIQRVYERGNADEKMKIESFYGQAKIKMALRNSKRTSYTLYQNKP